jgi:hypothetical protein
VVEDGGVVGRGRGMKKKLPGLIRRDNARRVACVGLALAAGMRGLLPLPRGENDNQERRPSQKKPQGPRKGCARIGRGLRL